uniref:Gdnf family receptor alpha 1b n=1 Tax=Hippocampus comes TaxID=109280 RepID=A0A3Q2XC22_HIPCM
MILTTFAILLSLSAADLVSASKGGGGEGEGAAARLDCVKASERCLREAPCSTKYRTMRQCVAGRHSGAAAAAVTAPEARGECRSAMEAIKQNPLNRCRCRRGMKKEKNCLRIFWSIYQSLQGNDLLEYSPYEPVNSRLSDIFRLAPIIAAEPASAKENNCLNAAKACNLNDTCKKYRSAYINPCTGRVSASEVCNKRKCHKALRHFFDKVTGPRRRRRALRLSRRVWESFAHAGAEQIQLRHALLLVSGGRPEGVRRTPPADHRARLLLRGQGQGQLFVSAERLQDQLHLQ